MPYRGLYISENLIATASSTATIGVESVTIDLDIDIFKHTSCSEIYYQAIAYFNNIFTINCGFASSHGITDNIERVSRTL